MNNIVSSNYLLKEFNIEEIEKILNDKSINDRLLSSFKGFEYSIKMVNQNFRAYEIILNLKW